MLAKTKTCPYCKKSILIKAKFCSFCGKSISVSKTDKKICPKCGFTAKLTAKFCSKCGWNLREPSVASTDVKQDHGGVTSSKELEDYSARILVHMASTGKLTPLDVFKLEVPSHSVKPVLEYINKPFSVKWTDLSTTLILQHDTTVVEILAKLSKEQAFELASIASSLKCGAKRAKYILAFVNLVESTTNFEKVIKTGIMPKVWESKTNTATPNLLKSIDCLRKDKKPLTATNIARGTPNGPCFVRTWLFHYEQIKKKHVTIPINERHRIDALVREKLMEKLENEENLTLEQIIIEGKLSLQDGLYVRKVVFDLLQSKSPASEISLELQKASSQLTYEIEKATKPILVTGIIESCFFCGEILEDPTKNCPDCKKSPLRCPICQKYIFFGAQASKCPKCEHIFHHSHLLEWLKLKGSCPVCKKAIKKPAPAYE